MKLAVLGLGLIFTSVAAEGVISEIDYELSGDGGLSDSMTDDDDLMMGTATDYESSTSERHLEFVIADTKHKSEELADEIDDEYLDMYEEVTQLSKLPKEKDAFTFVNHTNTEKYGEKFLKKDLNHAVYDVAEQDADDIEKDVADIDEYIGDIGEELKEIELYEDIDEDIEELKEDINEIEEGIEDDYIAEYIPEVDVRYLETDMAGNVDERIEEDIYDNIDEDINEDINENIEAAEEDITDIEEDIMNLGKAIQNISEDIKTQIKENIEEDMTDIAEDIEDATAAYENYDKNSEWAGEYEEPNSFKKTEISSIKEQMEDQMNGWQGDGKVESELEDYDYMYPVLEDIVNYTGEDTVYERPEETIDIDESPYENTELEERMNIMKTVMELEGSDGKQNQTENKNSVDNDEITFEKNAEVSLQNAILAGLIGGIIVSVLGILLIVHRIKKKDEGSYKIAASPSAKQALLNEEAYA